MVAATIISGTASASAAATCSPTGFIRDGLNLTAAQIGGPVTGALDATGCNIGVYLDATTTTGSVGSADISGANYYGIVVNGVSADVTNSTIHNIGDSPLSGNQHGNAILYVNGASGTISGNTVYFFQKNGITVSGRNADQFGGLYQGVTSASVLNNVVTGEGKIDYIAQNGIQISYGGSALVRGNTVSGFWYTPATVTSCGLLFFQAGGVKQQANSMSGNQTNLCNAGRGGGNFVA